MPGSSSEGLGASQPLHLVMALGLLSLHGTHLQLPEVVKLIFLKVGSNYVVSLTADKHVTRNNR